jgi:hypothetical protein
VIVKEISHIATRSLQDHTVTITERGAGRVVPSTPRWV